MESVLVSTGIFALSEMRDKTQVTTVALVAHYHAFFSVVAGTALGMMIANVPAIRLGDNNSTPVIDNSKTTRALLTTCDSKPQP